MFLETERELNNKFRILERLNLSIIVVSVDRGSAISLALSYCVILLQLVAYIYCSGVYTDTWDGQLLHFLSD